MNYNRVDFSLYVEPSLINYKVLQKEVPSASSFPHLNIRIKSKFIDLSSRDEIIKYLLTNKLIVKGISHSAWEQQTYEHLLSKTYILSLGISVGFFNRITQSLKNLPQTSTYEAISAVSSSLYEASKITLSDRFIKKIAKTNLTEFKKELDDWVFRLNKQKFHGGNSPDKADFLMFSCIEANSFFVRPLFKGNSEIEIWKENMSKCVDQKSIR